MIGGRQGVEGEIVKLSLADGDRFLLCTDGLHDSVSADRIVEILWPAPPTPKPSCRALVDAALDAGRPRQHHGGGGGLVDWRRNAIGKGKVF